MKPLFSCFTFFSLSLLVLFSTAEIQAGAPLPNPVGSVCVLVFEAPDHPISQFAARFVSHQNKVAAEGFDQKQMIDLTIAAKPSDLFRCIRERHSEIMFISHYLVMSESKEPGKARRAFTWFKPLPIAEGETESAGYGLQAIPPQVFRRARKLIQQTKESNPNYSLKSFRILSCDTEDLLAKYTSLRDLIEENQIQLDVGPNNSVMSWLMGQTVSGFDPVWFAQSLQYESNRVDSFYTYINLKTYGVLRAGQSAHALRGQYKVSVKGLAFGAGSEWTALHIPYKEVQGMKVGETRTVLSYHLDLSAALAGLRARFNPEYRNGKFYLLPETMFNEMNSVGFSLGLVDEVEITRNY